MVLQQWNDHLNPEWRRKWIEEARKYRDRIQNARLILALEEHAIADQ
jgi:hypothetical protein